MRGVIADTGPLYALRDPDDQHHLRAHEDSHRLSHDRLSVVVLWPTAVESYRLILHRLTLADAHQWLAQLRASADLINPTSEDYHQAGERVRRFGDQPITLVDAVVAVMSEQLGIPVWTFDHHFDVMGANVWR